MMNLPLEGIKVLEFATVLAGPAVGMFLAELGAEVIKVEPPLGDVTRKWKIAEEASNTSDDVSAYFSTINWGKKSIVIDLKNKSEDTLIQNLIRKSDIILTNFKYGDDIKLNLDYQKCYNLNNQIIYASISGYGINNPRTGYDAVLQAESGFMFLNREPNQPPNKVPVAIIDILSAHHLKEGILTALYTREKFKKGSHIHVSLWETALSSLTNQGASYAFKGVNPQPLGAEHPSVAPYGGVFQTSDHKNIMFAVGTDKQFAELCEIIDLNGIYLDVKFSSNPQRILNRKELNSLISDAVSKFELNYILDNCYKNQIPCGAIQTVEEALNHEESKNLFFINNNNMINCKNGIRTAIFLPNDQRIELSPPPKLGEHSEEIRKMFFED